MKREGKGFEPRKLAIWLDDGTSANAIVAASQEAGAGPTGGCGLERGFLSSDLAVYVFAVAVVDHPGRLLYGRGWPLDDCWGQITGRPMNHARLQQQTERTKTSRNHFRSMQIWSALAWCNGFQFATIFTGRPRWQNDSRGPP